MIEQHSGYRFLTNRDEVEWGGGAHCKQCATMQRACALHARAQIDAQGHSSCVAHFSRFRPDSSPPASSRPPFSAPPLLRARPSSRLICSWVSLMVCGQRPIAGSCLVSCMLQRHMAHATAQPWCSAPVATCSDGSGGLLIRLCVLRRSLLRNRSVAYTEQHAPSNRRISLVLTPLLAPLLQSRPPLHYHTTTPRTCVARSISALSLLILAISCSRCSSGGMRAFSSSA